MGIAIRRSYFDPAATVIEFVIDNDTEAQIVDVETKTSFLIANEYDCEVKAEIGVVAVEPQQRSFDAEG